MNTKRHSFKLKWKNEIVIAPRTFSTERYTYFVHIVDFNCSFVEVYLQWGKQVDNNINVILHNILKLYSNTKGLYFNFSYWFNNKKKTIKVYICE